MSRGVMRAAWCSAIGNVGASGRTIATGVRHDRGRRAFRSVCVGVVRGVRVWLGGFWAARSVNGGTLSALSFRDILWFLVAAVGPLVLVPLGRRCRDLVWWVFRARR